LENNVKVTCNEGLTYAIVRTMTNKETFKLYKIKIHCIHNKRDCANVVT